MNEISVKFVLDIVIKRIWAIIIAVAIFAGAAFFYNANFVDPVYSASSSVLGSNGGIVSENTVSSSTTDKIGSSDVASSLNIIDTYIDIMKTYGFYEYLSKESEIKKFDYTVEQLRKMTTVERRSDTSLFIDITVKCGNERQAVVIANSISTVAPQYIQTLLNNSYIVQADKCVSARMVAPLTMRNTALMGIFGGMLAVALFVLLAATDNTIKGEDDIVKKYNIPVLGVVPDFESKNTKGAK